MTSRSWLFTCYDLDCISSENPRLNYCIWQKEKCPTTDRLHYQGYTEWCSPVRHTYVQNWIGTECHCDKRKGTRDDAITYCSKEETRIEGPWEIGDRKSGGQGTRNDI